MQALATSTAPSKAVAAATSAAYAHCSASPDAAPAASQAAAVTASAVSSISAQRCFTAWKPPIGFPNCSRTLAYSTAVCRHQRATPEASAAPNVTAVRRTSSRVRPGTGMPVERSTSAAPNRRDRSTVCAGVTVAASAGTRNQRSSASPASRWVADGASHTTSRAGSRARPTTAPSGRSSTSAPADHRPEQRARHQLVRAGLEGDGLVEGGSPRLARSSRRPSRRWPSRPRRSARPASPSAFRTGSAPPSPAAHLRRLAASSTCSSEIPMDMLTLPSRPSTKLAHTSPDRN